MEQEMLIGTLLDRSGKPVSITKAIIIDKENQLMIGVVRFYRDGELLFELNVADGLLLGQLLKNKMVELYDDMVMNLVSLSNSSDDGCDGYYI